MADWVKIEINTTDTIKDLKTFAYDQFPFAYAKTLTETAKWSQLAVQERTRERFKLHSEYIPRGVRVVAAKKRDARTQRGAYSVVYTSKGITPFMAIHETGGQKRPKGKSLAVPARKLKTYQYRTKTGRIKKMYKPATLLQGFSNSARRRGKIDSGRKGRGFILPAKGMMKAAIARRKPRTSEDMEVLYNLIPYARIEPTWGFERTVRATANKIFNTIFEKEWRIALATAK